MSRFKGRPASGLPGALPAGEELLWQGAPDWRSLARHAFRTRWIAGYFGVLVLWRIGGSLAAGHNAAYAIKSGLSGMILGAVAVGLFTAFAWLISRTTTYTITSRRVVITYGMALPKSVNLPFVRVDAADLLVHKDGTGDIALKLPPATRLSYLLLLPHVRAGAQGHPQPVLRCVAEPEAIAHILSEALGNSLAETERAVAITQREPAAANGLQAQAA